jgi:protein TonB
MSSWRPKVLSAVLLVAAAPAAAQPTSPFGESIKDYGGAALLTEHWMSFRDYPRAAMRRGDQGRVVVEFDISANGRVENCSIKTSSGHKSLDNVPCPLLERKARFQPPIDAAGLPQPTRGVLGVDFWMP